MLRASHVINNRMLQLVEKTKKRRHEVVGGSFFDNLLRVQSYSNVILIAFLTERKVFFQHWWNINKLLRTFVMEIWLLVYS